MPEISRFFGMVITMYYNDHDPPHFHVRYGRRKGLIEIDTGTLLAGELPAKAMTLVREWTDLHRSELLEDWHLAKQYAPLNKIEPLE